MKAPNEVERVWHGAECRLAVSDAERGFSQLDDVLCPRVGELVSVEQREGLLVVRGPAFVCRRGQLSWLLDTDPRLLELLKALASSPVQ